MGSPHAARDVHPIRLSGSFGERETNIISLSAIVLSIRAISSPQEPSGSVQVLTHANMIAAFLISHEEFNKQGMILRLLEDRTLLQDCAPTLLDHRVPGNLTSVAT